MIVDPQTWGIGKPKSFDALGPAHGKLGRDPTSQTHAPKDDFFETQRVEQFQVVESHVLDGVNLVEAFALAEAGMGGNQHPKMFGKALEKGKPHERFIQGTGQVDKRRALAALANHRGLSSHRDGLGFATAPRQKHAGAVFQLLEGFKHCSPSQGAVLCLIL